MESSSSRAAEEEDNPKPLEAVESDPSNRYSRVRSRLIWGCRGCRGRARGHAPAHVRAWPRAPAPGPAPALAPSLLLLLLVRPLCAGTHARTRAVYARARPVCTLTAIPPPQIPHSSTWCWAGAPSRRFTR